MKIPSPRPAGLFALVILLVAGCASAPTDQPFGHDRDYPARWPAIAARGRDITELSGAYANAGTLIAEDGTEQPIQLASLLTGQTTYRHPLPAAIQHAEVLRLTVELCPPSRRLFGTVQFAKMTVTPKQEPESHVELNDLFFLPRGISHSLELPAFNSSSGAMVVVFIAAQSGASMMPATDGSLIVRIEHSSAGMITIVPFASTSHCYARFLRIVPAPSAEAKPKEAGTR